MPSVVHPLFGEMQAVLDYGNEMYFWEVNAPLETRLGSLEPTFDAPADGPTTDQTNRWHRILGRAEEYVLAARELLIENMAGFRHETMIDELELVSIDFYDRPDCTFEWGLGFELQSEGFVYTVLFAGDEPRAVTVDS